eukprot:11091904-Karenia_brevis.AAC.1
MGSARKGWISYSSVGPAGHFGAGTWGSWKTGSPSMLGNGATCGGLSSLFLPTNLPLPLPLLGFNF